MSVQPPNVFEVSYYTLKRTNQAMTEDIDIAITALRQIRSLDGKNVPKYAQKIARAALMRLTNRPAGSV